MFRKKLEKKNRSYFIKFECSIFDRSLRYCSYWNFYKEPFILLLTSRCAEFYLINEGTQKHGCSVSFFWVSVPWSKTFGKGCSNHILGRHAKNIVASVKTRSSWAGVLRQHRLAQNWNLEFRRKENIIKQTKCGTVFENLPSQYEAKYEKNLCKAIKATLRPENCKCAGYSILSFTFRIHDMRFF